ncbi:hypothetical protein SLA2020_388010 [Shorea laevis]
MLLFINTGDKPQKGSPPHTQFSGVTSSFAKDSGHKSSDALGLGPDLCKRIFPLVAPPVKSQILKQWE